MAKKQKEQSIEAFLKNNLHSKLQSEFGKQPIVKTEMPSYFATGLNPTKPLRSYQTEAFQYFFNHWEKEYDGKMAQTHVLFHMATGSGKTLIMAGLMLYLYEKGYRNFLFFVNSNNVIEKTRDNFFNSASEKYLFGQSITIGDKRVELREVDNFQDSDPDTINFCLQTIQGLHSDLNSPKENGITYDDFKNLKVVMIADEAHHINSATKSTSDSSTPGLFPTQEMGNMATSGDWETTVMRIFHANIQNILLEFTATEEFTHPAIADKYKDKVIFDYSLKKFREDGYSKDITVVQSDLPPIDRAVQAVIVSQFRRKLGSEVHRDLKPVVMFKSKTIRENKDFHDLFVETIRHLSIETLQRIKSNARDTILEAFEYFDKRQINIENLIIEIQEDFKEENLLLVDGNTITPEKQIHLNSLESKDNGFRAVFAVDMLNEGWDVLNLYDIVRLYDTRDARNGVAGATTNREAQLIGRGARYMPFLNKSKGPEGYVTKREFDNDLNNPLRHLETLCYHSQSNPRYIQELKTTLEKSGIIDDQSIEVEEKLKEEFKGTRLYKKGYVFINEPETYFLNERVTNIGTEILEHPDFPVRIATGEVSASSVFSATDTAEVQSLAKKVYKLGEFGKHVLRAAVNRFDSMTFESLHKILPNLQSIKQFIESDDYLSEITVAVYGRKEVVGNLSQREKLFVVTEVLKQIAPMLANGGTAIRGTKTFQAHQLRDVFRDHRYRVPQGSGNKEEGKSMKESNDPCLRLDLKNAEWYGYDDNFGTSEEKYLIKYIESIMDKLREKYCEVFLLRNYKDLKIYEFDNGQAIEPDFVLFLRKKGTEDRFDNIQIFIEPKGDHLREKDKWKETLLLHLHDKSEIRWITENDKFEIWGMPFYSQREERNFRETMETNFGI